MLGIAVEAAANEFLRLVDREGEVQSKLFLCEQTNATGEKNESEGKLRAVDWNQRGITQCGKPQLR